MERHFWGLCISIPEDLCDRQPERCLDSGAKAKRLFLAAACVLAISISGTPRAEETARPGVEPSTEWTCPRTHPIKGNFTTHGGERCIYHLPGGAYYERTKPERCYASSNEARSDGCRPSKR